MRGLPAVLGLAIVLVTSTGTVLGAPSPAGTTSGATYYVDTNHPNASDTNPGTEASPWKTLYRAGEPLGTEIVAGDTVLVKAGTYDVSTGGAWYRPAVNPVNSGQPGSPITFMAYPGNTVILDVKNVLQNPALGSYTRDYITIEGFTIINGGDRGIVVVGETPPVKGVIIQNNDVSGLRRPDTDNTDGLLLMRATDVVVRNNRFHDIRNVGNPPNAACVKMYSVDHTRMENNECYDAGAGLYDKANGQFNIFRRNLIHDVESDALRVSSFPFGDGLSHENEWYENIIYNCAIGAAFVPDNGPGTIYNISVHNNAIANCSLSGLSVGTFATSSYAGIAKFYNNIFYRTTAVNDLWTNDNPAQGISLSDYNLFAAGPQISVGNYVGSPVTYTTLASWQTATGHDMNSSVADPLFVDAPGRDYHLGPSSPALGAGRVGGVSTGAAVNIGAYATGTEVIGITGSLGPSPGPSDIIVFQDDFETGDLSRWDDVAAARFSVTSNASRVQSGTYSLEGLITPTSGYGELNKWFLPGYDEVYMKFDGLFEEGFQNQRGDGYGMHFFSGRGNRIDDQWSSSGQAGIKPDGTDFFYAGVDPEQTYLDPTLRPFQFYTYYPDMSCTGGCYGNEIRQTDPKVALVPGQWQEVVLYLRMNAPGEWNGAQALWIDGQKKIDMQDMRWRDTNDVRINQINVGNYMPGASQTQHLWMDNVVAWRPSTGDASPPNVHITAPANGAVVSGGAVTVSATATDDVGVVGVRFQLDGTNLGAEDTTAPYSVTWDSASVANAAHTLTAVARDAAGHTTTSSAVNITVSNANTPSWWPETLFGVRTTYLIIGATLGVVVLFVAAYMHSRRRR